MMKGYLRHIVFILIYALYRARVSVTQYATMGNMFSLIHGQEVDDSHTWIERSMAFHRCGSDKSCSHVAKLQHKGRFISITSKNELADILVSALWKKEQPVLSNIALHKNTASSPHIMHQPSSKVVDGYKGMKYFNDDCFGAETSVVNPWWRVDLANAAIVHSVSVTNGGEDIPTPSQMLKNFDIRIGYNDKTGANEICRANLTIWKSTTVKFMCDKEIIGKYVFIEKNTRGLILCEVEVYGIYI